MQHHGPDSQPQSLNYARTLVEHLILADGYVRELAAQELLARHPDLQEQLLTELEKLQQIEAIVGYDNALGTSHEPHSDAVSVRARIQIPGYEIHHRIGAGGQASVVKATQLSTGQPVAIKAIYGGVLLSPKAKERFDREIRILVELDHPHIVSVIDRGTTDEGTPFVVMRYVDGVNLDEWLSTREAESNKRHDHVELQRRLRLFVRICRAVDAAHRKGIVHRDLKPSNIRIDARDKPFILDFGLARQWMASQDELGELSMKTHTGQFIGSLPWASPEQMGANDHAVDAHSDVYSLGLVLYELLTGRLPHDMTGGFKTIIKNMQSAVHTAPSALLRRSAMGTACLSPVTPELDAIALKAIAFLPDQRYGSAGLLADDVQAYIDHRTTSVGRQRRSQRARWVARVALAASLVVLVPLSMIYWLPSMPSSKVVQGIVWMDADRNGFLGPEESGLSGIRVYLDSNENGQWDPSRDGSDSAEPYVFTDASGHYELAWPALAAPIRCVVPDDFAVTFPSRRTTLDQQLYTLVKSETLRRVEIPTGGIADFEVGTELPLAPRSELPQSMWFVTERDDIEPTLCQITNHELLIGWQTDRVFQTRLTLSMERARFIYAGSVPLNRAVTFVGDVNGDALDDLVLRWREGVPNDEDDWFIQIACGRIDGTFDFDAPAILIARRHRVVYSTLDDVDGDGILDMLFQTVQTGGYFTMEIKLARGNGDGSFQFDTAEIVLTGPPDHGLTLGPLVDVNGDGRLDIFLAPDDDTQDEGQSYFAIKQADGTYRIVPFIDFVPENEGGGQDLSQTGSAHFFDLDSDGELDLFIDTTNADAPDYRIYRSVNVPFRTGVWPKDWTYTQTKHTRSSSRVFWPHIAARTTSVPAAHLVYPRHADRELDFHFGLAAPLAP